jgi:hypothetical protein
MCQFRHPTDLPADVDPIGIRQHDIEQDGSRHFAPAKCSRVFSRRQTGDRESFPLEVISNERQNIGIIFNNNYLFLGDGSSASVFAESNRSAVTV